MRDKHLFETEFQRVGKISFTSQNQLSNSNTTLTKIEACFDTHFKKDGRIER